MLDQGTGKMFLAGERGCNETNLLRSYNTFNFGTFQNEHKGAFGPLYALNDHTLAGGQSMLQVVEEDAEVLLIPIVGSIVFSDCLPNLKTVHAGQVQVLTRPKGTAYKVTNPFEGELVNYIEIWIKRSLVSPGTTLQLVPFHLDKNKNTLLQLSPVLPYRAEKSRVPYKLSIAKMEGRKEMIYGMAKPGNGLFVFVIEGAFEVQYRLLEYRDGLALWAMKEIEIEALSNDAIILIMEVLLPAQ